MHPCLILCYHSISDSNRYSISVKEFSDQMRKLSSIADFISLAEAIAITKGELTPPRSCVAITFDDGYKDVLAIAPVIQAHRIPASLFVLSEPERANREELDNQGPLLSFADIRALGKQGWTIGCHSATHPNFDAMDTMAFVKEISQAKQTLERKLHTTVKYFAYPKGRHSPTIRGEVVRAGYHAALATGVGFVRPGTDVFSLPRTVITRTMKADSLSRLFRPYWHIRQQIGYHAQYYLPAVFSSGGHRPSLLLPKRVGSYRLIAPLPKYATPKKFLIGKYEKGGKFYAIKVWYQGMPDVYHNELLREFRAAAILHDALNSRNNENTIRIQTPRPVELFRTKTFTALISEYTQGKPLSRYHSHIRARVLAQTIEEFERISHRHLRDISPLFRRHPWWLYAFSLPYVAIRACLKREIPIKHIVFSTWTCIRHLSSLAGMPTVLAHRDLLPENILVNGKKIIVLDCTHLVLTPKGYDLTYICIHEILHGLSEKIIRRLNAKPDPFFTAYICLLNSDNYNPVQNANYYAATLAAAYES